MKMKTLVAVIAILWIGMILAIGMESIVKFNTPTLTKPVAFDVGRTVFAAFNKVQLGLLALLVIGMLIGRLGFIDNLLITVLAAILAMQIFWLFPELSQRVDLILAGRTPPATYQHGLYGMLEIIKLIIIAALAFRGLFTHYTSHLKM